MLRVNVTEDDRTVRKSVPESTAAGAANPANYNTVYFLRYLLYFVDEKKHHKTLRRYTIIRTDDEEDYTN